MQPCLECSHFCVEHEGVEHHFEGVAQITLAQVYFEIQHKLLWLVSTNVVLLHLSANG